MFSLPMNTLDQLQEIFNEVQDCDSKTFSENIQLAMSIIPKDNSLLRIFDTLLMCQRNTVPTKVSYFIKRILEELIKTNKNIFDTILLYLVNKTSCKSTKVRKNALKIINIMLSIDVSSPNEEVLAKVAERLFDKEQSVRKEALKISIPFQNYPLSDKITIQTTIKDIVRYDTSHEIRRIGFLGLDFCPSTFNCILERCIDSNVNIRKTFWLHYFSRIDLKQLEYSQRIYLMKRGICEREFDAKQIFLERIREYGLNQFVDDFYCEDKEYEVCINEYLNNCNDEYELSSYTPSYLHFMCCYYKYIEEKKGKDSLNLLPLEEFLQIFYFKCTEAENTIDKSTVQSNISDCFKVLKYFLRILSFYDLFTSESKKYVYSIVNHLIVKSNFTETVDDCVSLIVKTCTEDLTKIAGSLIKKTKGRPICFAICEAVVKYVEYGMIHDAIVNEIAIFDIESSLDILFWYFIKNPNENIKSQYLSFLPNKKVVEGCADLVLKGILDAGDIEDVFLRHLSKFNVSFVIPMCKLLLGKKINSNEAVKYLLLIFYSTEEDQIQQYLSLFFFEYFRFNPDRLIEIFCEVLELISSNHRVYVDQALFWISNTPDSIKIQQLYFNICVFIVNNYDELKNRKQMFAVLTRIHPDSTWDKITNKKIIVVLGLIIRKRPRENLNLLLNLVLEIDDGVPLSAADYEDLKLIVKME